MKERYFQYTFYLILRMISCFKVYLEKLKHSVEPGAYGEGPQAAQHMGCAWLVGLLLNYYFKVRGLFRSRCSEGEGDADGEVAIHVVDGDALFAQFAKEAVGAHGEVEVFGV